MSKLVLQDIESGYGTPTKINANNDAIEAALENTLSRDGTSPNQMEANLDMNSNRILNLPSPQSATEPLRFEDAQSLSTVPIAPSMTGNADKVLKTDGTTASWSQVTDALVSTTAAIQISKTKIAATSAETSSGITIQNYYYPAYHIFRYMTSAQISDVTSYTGSVDVSTVIQNAINTTAAAGTSYIKETLIFPPGLYNIGTTGISIADNTTYCHLASTGLGVAKFIYSGTGAAVTVGNDTSNGILPARIKNIYIFKANHAAGTVGLKVSHASYGYYEGVQVTGFETAVYIKGSIGCTFDFKGLGVDSAVYGFKIESSQGSGGGLRFAPNLTTIKNAVIGACDYGVYIAAGSGVSPAGAGAVITLDKVNFEHLNSGATAIYASGLGEIWTMEELVVRDCWFEFYGARVADISACRVRFEHCSIANGATDVFRLNNDSSYITLQGVMGYFTDTPPSSGYLVTLTGSATTAAYANIKYERSSFTNFNKLHATWPVNDQGVYIKQPYTYKVAYNANYPSGNGDYNYGLALALFTEANKFAGSSWTYADVVFVGSDTLNAGHASLRLYRCNGQYFVKELEAGSATTLTNSTASNATLTFNNDGTGRWYQMTGVWTIY